MTSMGVLIFLTIMVYVALLGGAFFKKVPGMLLLLVGAAFEILVFYLASPAQWYDISRVTVWVGLGTAFIAGIGKFFED
jgi:hypothetical protein